MTNELVQATFDYSLVTEEQASQLQVIYNRVLIRHVATAYEDGKDLVEAENIQGLPYAMLIAWAQACYGWSESTIKNKKNAYLYWGDFTPPGGVIDDHAIYLLSTKRVPESARQEAKERLNKGEDITEEVAKQIRDAHKAKEQAEQEAKQARKQLWQVQEISQKRSEQLNEQLSKSQLEIELLTAKKSIGISPEAQEKINKLIEQRDNLSKLVDELSADLDTTEAQREQEARDLRVRQAWQKDAKAMFNSIMRFLGQLPMGVDTQIFESEDWMRLDEVVQAFRSGIEACDRLRASPALMIVDASYAK